jgi:hypothetical protein
MAEGRFRVKGQLVAVLGQLYRSSEEALKELVTNCWDADATRVDIVLPMALAGLPITIRDNGCGMTPLELEARYLDVAFDRRRLSTTTQRGRKVRGHRGVGKFAGFLIADRVTVTTVARDTRSHLVLDKQALQTADEDLEDLGLPIEVESCGDGTGTVVELSHLRRGFEQPSETKLGRLLLHEFGVQDDFAIYINEIRLTPDVVAGRKVQLVGQLTWECRV